MSLTEDRCHLLALFARKHARACQYSRHDVQATSKQQHDILDQGFLLAHARLQLPIVLLTACWQALVMLSVWDWCIRCSAPAWGIIQGEQCLC